VGGPSTLAPQTRRYSRGALIASSEGAARIDRLAMIGADHELKLIAQNGAEELSDYLVISIWWGGRTQTYEGVRKRILIPLFRSRLSYAPDSPKCRG
jgi:hypothetical protein